MSGRNSNKSSKGSNNANTSRRGNSNRTADCDCNTSDIGTNANNTKNKRFRQDNKSKANDASWYSHYPELVRDTARPAFSYPLGTNVPYNYSSGTPGYPTIPGIMRINYVTSIGQTDGANTEAVNKAANRMYTFIRRNVSTYAAYDSTDMMMYTLAMDSLFMMYGVLCRAYGIMNNYKVYNRYFAESLIESMGIDFEDFKTNLADYRAQINQIAVNLVQFCVPSGMDYIKRHMWLASNLFYDANSVKSQTYYFMPDGYYTYEEVTEGPAKLVYHALFPTDAKVTMGVMIADVNRMLAKIMSSQDCIAMSGDIMRAFGGDRVYMVTPISELYYIDPIFSEEVLSQIENATIMGPLINDAALGCTADITQNTIIKNGVNLIQSLGFGHALGTKENALVALTDSYGYLKSNFVLNMHKDDVTPDDVMVATRLSNIVTTTDTLPRVGDKTHFVSSPARCGSEVVTTVSMFYVKGTELKEVKIDRPCYRHDITANDFSQMGIYACWSVFDWAPKLGFDAYSSVVGSQYFTFQDVDNYAVLSDANLEALHDTALQSLFTEPAIAELGRKPVNK